MLEEIGEVSSSLEVPSPRILMRKELDHKSPRVPEQSNKSDAENEFGRVLQSLEKKAKDAMLDEERQ